MASADKQVRSKLTFPIHFLLTFKGKSPSKEQKTLKEIEDQKAAIKKAHERKVYKNEKSYQFSYKNVNYLLPRMILPWCLVCWSSC